LKQLTTTQLLGLGIKAAQSDLQGVARDHFIAALKQDPHNTLALLWLATIAPTPTDSLRIFQRVLALDPANKHAQAGLRWVQRRLNLHPPAGQTHPVSLAQPPRAELSTALPPGDRPTKPLSVIPTAPPRSGEIQAPAGPPQLAPGSLTQSSTYFTSGGDYTGWLSESDQTAPLLPFHFAFKAFLVVCAVGALGLALGLSIFLFASGQPLVIPGSVSNQRPSRDIVPHAPVQSFLSPAQTSFLQTMTPVEDMLVFVEPFEPGAEPFVISPQHIAPVSANSDREIIQAGSAAVPPLLIGRALPPEPVDPALLVYQPAYPGEKWIEVNVTTQEVTAWEGNLPVMSFKASTGQPDTPTILGQFRIYWKLQKTDMSGFNYYVPDVPYAMFFQGDYALHGTYWHNLFGHPISRGCVNLSIADGKKLFDWAGPLLPLGQTEVVASYDNPGTLVIVHE
jgi:hypothetical protein